MARICRLIDALDLVFKGSAAAGSDSRWAIHDDVWSERTVPGGQGVPVDRYAGGYRTGWILFSSDEWRTYAVGECFLEAGVEGRLPEAESAAASVCRGPGAVVEESRVPPLTTRYFITGSNKKIMLEHDEDFCAPLSGSSAPADSGCVAMDADARLDMNAAYYMEQTHHATNATAWMITGQDQVDWLQLRVEHLRAWSGPDGMPHPYDA